MIDILDAKSSVIEKYQSTHKQSPAFYAQRFAKEGNSADLAIVIQSLNNLLPQDKVSMREYIGTLIPNPITRDKLPQGVPASVLLLLYYCYSTLFPNQNPNQFDFYLQKLLSKRFAPAMTFHAISQLGTADNRQALFDLELAANLNCAHANDMLGTMMMQGNFGLRIDATKAMDYLMRAKEHHSPDAFYTLGYLILKKHQKEKQTKEDLQAAHDYFATAASAGHTDAMIELGEMYRLGLGVPVNKKLAYELQSSVVQFANRNYTSHKAIARARGRGSLYMSNTSWFWATPPRGEDQHDDGIAVELTAVKEFTPPTPAAH